MILVERVERVFSKEAGELSSPCAIIHESFELIQGRGCLVVSYPERPEGHHDVYRRSLVCREGEFLVRERRD